MIGKNKIEMPSKGSYSLRVVNKLGEDVVEKAVKKTSNVVTYQGAYLSLFDSKLFSNLYAAIGTGSSEITRASTALGAEASGRSGGVLVTRTGKEQDNLDGTSTLTLKRVFSFPLGSKVGTFSEVGIFDAGSGGNLIAGQLIKDELGNPTTVTLLADEQLIVEYTLEWTIPNTSSIVGTGTVTDASSNTYNYELYAQPYFVNYAIGVNSQTTNYSSGAGQYILRGSNGTTDYGLELGAGPTISFSHDGNGVVSMSTSSYTLSPSAVTASNVTFVGVSSARQYYQTAPAYDIVDTVACLRASDTLLTPAPVYAKFLNTFTKTADDSFSLRISMTISI